MSKEKGGKMDVGCHRKKKRGWVTNVHISGCVPYKPMYTCKDYLVLRIVTGGCTRFTYVDVAH